MSDSTHTHTQSSHTVFAPFSLLLSLDGVFLSAKSEMHKEMQSSILCERPEALAGVFCGRHNTQPFIPPGY